MATRSYIGIEVEGIDAVSCFYDGYPKKPYGVGSVLLTHYSSPISVRDLLNEGDITCLGPVIGSKVDPDEYLQNHGHQEQSLFYRRDWGQPRAGNTPVRFATREAFAEYLSNTDARFAYLYTHGEGWIFGSIDAEPGVEWMKLNERALTETKR